MKRLSVTLIFLFLCTHALAATPNHKKISAAVQESFPKLTVDEVNDSPLPGVYEIVSRDRIFYYAPDTGHLLIGNLISREGENITTRRVQEVMEKRIKGLPLGEALKIGSGPHQVIEVTDPDCSFCRKGSHYFDSRQDITRHIFFKPLQTYSQSRAKAAYILSSPDPQTAYKEVFSGKYDQQPLPSVKDNGQLERQAKVIEPLKVNSTPSYWINGTYVAGSDLRRIQQLLDPPAATNHPPQSPAPSGK
ncbi:MAG: DsbC family protein [Desulfuromonadaceae bacterium]|nr:DsbC family protein [Desulfuromonadaceae bacterium]